MPLSFALTRSFSPLSLAAMLSSPPAAVLRAVKWLDRLQHGTARPKAAGRPRHQPHRARWPARRAGLGGRAAREGLHSERSARRRSRRRSTPKCGWSMTTTRCTSACSPRTINRTSIIISELRKDFNTGNSDSFIVIIDTFKDERNGYQFAVNPAGAKWDAQMSNEGRENNGNWDGVWDVRHARGRRRLVRGDAHSVPHAEVQSGGAADLGHQFPAAAAPAQREQLLVAAAAHPRPLARVDGRNDRGSAGHRAGQQPSHQAVRARPARAVSAAARTRATSMPDSTSSTA